MNNKYIEIGRIVNTFGLKGELKIQSESDFTDYRFRVGAKIYLKTGRMVKEYEVSSYRILKGNVIITINDLKDINQVEHLVGAIVLTLKDDIPPLKDNEYLIDDLVGLDAYDESNQHIGLINDVIMLPSNEVLEIKMNDGSIKLIPFVDEFIVSINEKKIIIKLLEVEL